jgi:hypothetical protein
MRKSDPEFSCIGGVYWQPGTHKECASFFVLLWLQLTQQWELQDEISKVYYCFLFCPFNRQARPENDAGGGPDDKTLPSNWDSNEALPLSDTDAEELARVAEEPEQHIDVKPKSRGADYNYLLTQDLIPLHHNVPGMDFLVSSSWILKRCLMATRWLFSWMYFACFGLSTLQSCFTGGNVCSSLCIRPLLLLEVSVNTLTPEDRDCSMVLGQSISVVLFTLMAVLSVNFGVLL